MFSFSAERVSKLFRQICDHAGIEGLHFHDLRHEATSRLFERTDLDLMEIRRITGHESIQMLARYTHFRSNDLAHRLDGMPRGGHPDI